MSDRSLRLSVSSSDGSDNDSQILRLAENFRRVDHQLDHLVTEDTADSAESLTPLHREWADLCSRAAALPASTHEARRAKAAMLLTVLQVIVPPAGTRELHEVLAESLARDLVH